MAVNTIPRQGWKPRLSILGLIGGLLTGASVVVLLQQSGKVYPSLTILIVALVVGALLGGVVVPSIFRLVARGRANKAIDRVNSLGASQAAPAVTAPTAAPAVAPAPAPSAAGAPPSVPAPSSAGAPPAMPAPSAAAATPPAQPAAGGWVPTHIVPSAGVSAYARPNHKTAPVATIDAGLKVRLINTQRTWSQVEFDNGWTGWVDTASLQAL